LRGCSPGGDTSRSGCNSSPETPGRSGETGDESLSQQTTPQLLRRRDKSFTVDPGGLVWDAGSLSMPSAASGSGGEAPAECWICRESGGPLVRPCRCRGTMAGVHAACVEAWVRCHRREPRRELPHCPVCRAPYRGCDRRPGLYTFVTQAARSAARQLHSAVREGLHLALLGLSLAQHGALGEGGLGREQAVSDRARWWRFAPLWADTEGKAVPVPDAAVPLPPPLATLALVVLILLKTAVLVASLPAGRMGPPGRWARPFFTPDLWRIVRTVADLLAVSILLGLQCVRGGLPPGYFALAGMAALAPAVPFLVAYPVSVWLREVVLFLSFITAMPALTLFELGRLVVRHRRHLGNPLDGRTHVILALVVMSLCLGCHSLRPATALIMAHTALLVVGLWERVMVNLLPWQDSQAWWAAVLIALEVVSMICGQIRLSLVLLLVALRTLNQVAVHPRPQAIFQGSLWWCVLLLVGEVSGVAFGRARGTPADAFPAQVVAVVWLGLLCGLACAVNWRRGLRHYHSWQRRHAAFVLCTSGASHEGVKTLFRMVPPVMPGSAVGGAAEALEEGEARPHDADLAPSLEANIDIPDLIVG